MSKKLETKPIKRTAKDWLKALVLLLDEAVALLVVILVLRFFEIKIPLAITVVIALLVGTSVFVTLKAIIPSFHRKQVTGREGMIGQQAIVVRPLTPLGAVTVQGEYWRAVSIDDNIKVDADVEVIGIEGLTLRVVQFQED